MNRSIGRATTALVAVLAFTGARVDAGDKDFYSNGEFEKILHKAGKQTKHNKTHTEDGLVPIFVGAEGSSGNK